MRPLIAGTDSGGNFSEGPRTAAYTSLAKLCWIIGSYLVEGERRCGTANEGLGGARGSRTPLYHFFGPLRPTEVGLRNADDKKIALSGSAIF